MGTSPELMQEFERLILRDRNHPSVILWSIGNEEWVTQNSETGAAIARKLVRVQHQLDPGRLSTYAADNGDRYEGINSVVDVRGVNYIRRGDVDAYHRKHPQQPIIGTEESDARATRGVYETAAGFVSDYDANIPGFGSTAEQWWSYYAARPWLAGAFVWSGFDYRGEPSPYTWPNVSASSGILDLCGFPKNNFFYYQSKWSDTDVLHLSPHWNWRGKEGQPIDVWCFSNAESVELFLNGKSLGRKGTPRNGHLQWSVPFEPGTLEARGKRDGRSLATKMVTTGAPASIALTPDRSRIAADGQDVAVITVTALDAKDREVPDAIDLIRFFVDGPGVIIGVGNGDPTSHESEKASERHLFSGKCQLIVQSSGVAGPITIRATAEGLKPAAIMVNASD
jgi:beta-galactosidase